MNLHGIAKPFIAAVNPMTEAEVRISNGWTTVPGSGGSRAPAYEAPGAIVGSIAGDVLTVTAQTAGKLVAGQTVLGAGISPGTVIDSQITGGPGGIGTYRISAAQTVASEAMTTALLVQAQVQALTFKDLTQIDGLNLQGTRRAIYLFGKVQGVNKAEQKGGDLVVISSGASAGTWLVAEVLEQWPDWCKVAATQQQN